MLVITGFAITTTTVGLSQFFAAASFRAPALTILSIALVFALPLSPAKLAEHNGIASPPCSPPWLSQTTIQRQLLHRTPTSLRCERATSSTWWRMTMTGGPAASSTASRVCCMPLFLCVCASDAFVLLGRETARSACLSSICAHTVYASLCVAPRKQLQSIMACCSARRCCRTTAPSHAYILMAGTLPRCISAPQDTSLRPIATMCSLRHMSWYMRP